MLTTKNLKRQNPNSGKLERSYYVTMKSFERENGKKILKYTSLTYNKYFNKNGTAKKQKQETATVSSRSEQRSSFL